MYWYSNSRPKVGCFDYSVAGLASEIGHEFKNLPLMPCSRLPQGPHPAEPHVSFGPACRSISGCFRTFCERSDYSNMHGFTIARGKAQRWRKWRQVTWCARTGRYSDIESHPQPSWTQNKRQRRKDSWKPAGSMVEARVYRQSPSKIRSCDQTCGH